MDRRSLFQSFAASIFGFLGFETNWLDSRKSRNFPTIQGLK